MRIREVVPASVFAGVAVLLCGASASEAGAPALRVPSERTAPELPKHRVAPALPSFLVENTGWTHPEVRWVAKCRGYRAFLTDDGVVVGIPERSARRKGQSENFPRQSDVETPAANVSIRLEGARRGTAFSAARRADGVASFFLGDDPARWRSRVPLQAAVARDDWRDGVDAVWSIEGGDLRFDLRLDPGVDASSVRLRLDGCETSIAADGSAVLRTAPGEVRLSRPVAWHEAPGGRRPALVDFSLDGGALTFRCRDRDPSLPLVIDPVVSYAAYFGGSASAESVQGIDVDGSGNVLIGGYTSSTNLPVTTGAYQTVHAGGIGATYPNDYFAAGFQSDGSTLTWCTYVGGSGWDDCFAMVAEQDGDVVLSGESASTNAPAQGGPQASSGGGTSDAFVAKLDAGGATLAWGTYLGGSGQDQAIGLEQDPSGNVLVCGWTTSQNFPVASARQSSWGGASSDGFLAKIAANGASFAFATLHGGAGLDQCNAVVADATGAIYVGGWTNSTNFPVQSAVQSTYTTSYATTPNDAFVSKLPSNGAALAWSTYYGGSGFDEVNGIAVDGSAQCTVIGWTSSANFALKSPMQTARYGSDDIFLIKFAASGAATAFSTYLGGSGREFGAAVAYDSGGNLWCAAMSTSSDFPLQNPIQATFAGGGPANFPDDTVIFRASSDGTKLLFSTYFGGSGYEDTVAVAVDSSDSIHFCGFTNSSNLPVQGGSTGQLTGAMEGFHGRISRVPPAAPTALQASTALLQPVTLTWTDNASNETGFEVERRFGAQPWGVVKTVGANVTTTQDAQVAADLTFTYRVRAVNVDGVSSPSNEVTITTPPVVPLAPPPDAPGGIALTVVSASEIDVAWDDRSDDERGFEVQRRVGAGNFATLVATPPNAERQDDLTCLPGWTYTYRVRAFASAGPSGFTDAASAATPGTFSVAVAKGKLTDSGKPLKDTIKCAGTWSFPEDAADTEFDPRTSGLSVHMGRSGAGLTLEIPAGDDGWKGKGTRITWTAPKDAALPAKITLDLAKRTWSATFSKVTFLVSTSTEVHVMLACGAHGGRVAADWEEQRTGVLVAP